MYSSIKNQIGQKKYPYINKNIYPYIIQEHFLIGNSFAESNDIGNKPEIISHQPESITHWLESISERPESISHRPESISQRPESIKQRPESISKRPESISKRPEGLWLSCEMLPNQRYSVNVQKYAHGMCGKSGHF